MNKIPKCKVKKSHEHPKQYLRVNKNCKEEKKIQRQTQHKMKLFSSRQFGKDITNISNNSYFGLFDSLNKKSNSLQDKKVSFLLIYYSYSNSL